MNIRSEMESRLRSKLLAASNSTLYTSARLTELIQDAYMWATMLFIWMDLVKAKLTSTEADQEYYDYPTDFRSGTIVRLTVDDVEYTRKNFEDYLDFKENNPTSTEKIFANYGRQYFISPKPTANGVNNISVWGAIQAPALSNASDKTIFSDNKVEGNDAVIKKAFAEAILRTDPKLADKESAEAAATLLKMNKDEWRNIQRDQRIQHPKFNVPDFFASGLSADPIGGFRA